MVVQNKHSKVKQTLAAIVIITIALGFYAETNSSIPDNAKLLISPEHGVYIPEVKSMFEEYAVYLGEEEFLRTNWVRGTWADVKSKKYGDLHFPDDVIVTRDSVTGTTYKPIIVHLVIGPKERWTEDGSWNY